MRTSTEKLQIVGPAGTLECALDTPSAARGLALVCHPHPLHGGTMDNKVTQTLARAFVQLGYAALRFNFRGVGGSAGKWAEGLGEVDDAMAVLKAFLQPGQALVIGGFSFGAYVASHVAAQVNAACAARVERLVLVGPAVQTFTMAPVPDDTLVIHGETDDVVALSEVLNWARPQALPVTVLPGAGHFFHGQLPKIKEIVWAAWPASAHSS